MITISFNCSDVHLLSLRFAGIELLDHVYYRSP